MNGELIPKLLIFATIIFSVIALADALIPKPNRESLLRDTLRSTTHTLLPVLIAVLLLRSFIAEPFRIPSSSMEPGLMAGDYILVNKYRYGLRLPLTNRYLFSTGNPRRGDVAVFFPPEDDRYFIKRVVGLPGDLISYHSKRLSVNGRPINYRPLDADALSDAGVRDGFRGRQESLGGSWHALQIHLQAGSQDFNIRVKKDHYFVMGDNRDNSRDSRVWGQVPRSRFIGPAILVWMHWRGFGTLPSFARFGSVE